MDAQLCTSDSAKVQVPGPEVYMSGNGRQELLKNTAEQQLLCATAKSTLQYDVRHAECDLESIAT